MTQKFDKLLAWGQSHGVQFNGVEIRFINKQKGYGLFATRDLSPGEVIIRTPIETELTYSKILYDEYFSEVKEHKEKLNNEEMLILAMALEKQKGQNSLYHLYLDFLPEKFKFGHMDDDIDEMPLSASIPYKVETELRSETLKKIKEQAPTVPQKSLEWAYQAYKSRGFEKNRSFSPFIDMMNASQTPQAWLKSRIWTSDKDQKQDFANVIINEGCSVKKDSEVFLSYAEELSNVQLWCRHGFVFPNNKNNNDVVMNINEVIRIMQLLKFFTDAGKGNDELIAVVENGVITKYMDDYFDKVFEFYGERARGSRQASAAVMKKEFFQALWEDRSRRKKDADLNLEFAWNDELQLIGRVLQKL